MKESSKNLNIILISGKARAGKDTFATFLEDEIRKHISDIKENAPDLLTSKHYIPKLAFADGVKEEARRFGWNGEKDEKGRTMLQNIGNGYRGKYFIDVWVDNLFYSFYNYFLSLNLSSVDFITQTEEKKTFWLIITDCRYPNEVIILNNPLFSRMAILYGWNINVNFVNITGSYSGKETLSLDQNKHTSETALESSILLDSAYKIINDGTLDDLKGSVKKFISKDGEDLFSEKYNM